MSPVADKIKAAILELKAVPYGMRNGMEINVVAAIDKA